MYRRNFDSANERRYGDLHETGQVRLAVSHSHTKMLHLQILNGSYSFNATKISTSILWARFEVGANRVRRDPAHRKAIVDGLWNELQIASPSLSG
jgi:hypothetical protein